MGKGTVTIVDPGSVLHKHVGATDPLSLHNLGSRPQLRRSLPLAPADSFGSRSSASQLKG